MLSRMFEIRDLLSQDRSRGSVVERYFDRQNTSNITNKILINGPHSCGKTSLLFSLALSFAEDGKNVLFLSPRKFNKLPAFPEGKQRPLTNVLQKIRMVYLESSNELLKYLASVDMDQISNVDCIAIDDLDFYIHNGQKNEDLTTLARILAYAVEAYDFIKRGSTTYSILAISAVYSKQNLYERWMDHILRITVNKDSKHNEKQCEMSVHQPNSNELLDIHYTLTDTEYTVTQITA